MTLHPCVSCSLVLKQANARAYDLQRMRFAMTFDAKAFSQQAEAITPAPLNPLAVLIDIKTHGCSQQEIFANWNSPDS